MQLYVRFLVCVYRTSKARGRHPWLSGWRTRPCSWGASRRWRVLPVRPTTFRWMMMMVADFEDFLLPHDYFRSFIKITWYTWVGGESPYLIRLSTDVIWDAVWQWRDDWAKQSAVKCPRVEELGGDKKEGNRGSVRVLCSVSEIGGGEIAN